MVKRRSEQMTLHVMDSEQRNPARKRQRLAITDTNEQRANQSRSVRNGYGIEIIELRPSFFDGALDHRHDAGEMRARCNLRNDSAEDAMYVLRQDDQRFLGDVVAFPLEDGRRRLVARSFDAEYSRHVIRCARSAICRPTRAPPANSSRSPT